MTETQTDSVYTHPVFELTTSSFSVRSHKYYTTESTMSRRHGKDFSRLRSCLTDSAAEVLFRKHSFGFFTNTQNWQHWHYIFPYICSFMLYFHHMMLVNVKLDVSGYKSIIFRGCRRHWSGSFVMAQLKRSWHSCIEMSLWKNSFVLLLLLSK